MSTDQQAVEFERYDFDTQYEIYLCSQQRVEPLESGLAPQFAKKGTSIVEPLEAKLERANDDYTIREIVRVFREMSDEGTYAVVEDRPLMDKLRHKASSIRNPKVRLRTQDFVQDIRCKAVPNKFFDMSTNEQMVEFEKYDFDTQYEIYICSQERVEPPELELATRFAKEGKAIVKPLDAKLAEAEDDYTIRDILYVFSEMSEQGTYDVANDKSLMNKLLLKVNSISSPAVRAMAEDSLQYIRRPLRSRGGGSVPKEN